MTEPTSSWGLEGALSLFMVSQRGAHSWCPGHSQSQEGFGGREGCAGAVQIPAAILVAQ